MARAGDVENAVKAVDHLFELLDPNFEPHRRMIEQAQSLKSMLIRDPEAAQKQLDDWEAQTTRNLGLEEYRV